MKSHNAMHGLFASGTLTNGTAQVVVMREAPLPATVWVRPAGGDTVLVEYSNDNGANYAAWPVGGAVVYSEDVLVSGVTHLRVTRTAGAGTTSTYGIC